MLNMFQKNDTLLIVIIDDDLRFAQKI